MDKEINNDGLLQMETRIVAALKEVYDPEIPVNIYDLGLIYDIHVGENNDVTITMTLTAPNCPIADDILLQVKETVEAIEGVKSATVDLVFDPPWTKDMISEEALLELGLL
ncbi:MAG: iron-sulfur cluster assembly protein [Bacteroidales bacterium]|jgi:FeS assembly SUF system protein|nr:iron-sulfur cluster assembly protein [Bacteroidales bacterium]